MKKYFLLIIVLLSIVCNAPANAHFKKRGSNYLRLVEAYTQRTIPGIQNVPVITSYHIIVIWESKSYPETFFWRGENGWLACSVTEARKAASQAHGPVRGGEAYTTTQVANADIRKGDTLELQPISDSKLPVPEGLPDEEDNTLYFKTNGSHWLTFHVEHFGKKHDQVML